MAARRSVPRGLRLADLAPRAVAMLRAMAHVAPRADAALVGGTVRDALLKRAPADVDVDVAVPRGALDLARRVADRVGGAYLILDAERGAARVITESARLDVTDWRAPTLADDLMARDFTVNALAVSLRALLRDGAAAIVDPARGRDDLAAGRLRLPAAHVLADDPLRALRGVRLEASLGLSLTPGATRAIRVAAPALSSVSIERVRDELLAIVALASGGATMRRLDALGLLRAVFPEVEAMRRTTQPRPHRFDVLEHSLRAVAGVDRALADLSAFGDAAEALAAHLAEPVGGGVTRAQLLRLGALLHDVAKPETRRVERGRIRFFEHDLIGAARTREIGERLKLPTRATAVVERLVRQHLRPMHLAQAGEITSRARYRFFRDVAEDSQDLLLLAIVDGAAVTGISPAAAWRRSAAVRDLMTGWQETRAVSAAPPLLRGEDVMRHFGLPPGPAVGALLERAREAQALGLVQSAQEALRYLDSSGDDP